MFVRRPVAIGLFVLLVAFVSACGGSRTVPTLPELQQSAVRPHTAAVTPATTTVVDINAGGAATGSFLADQDYTSTSGTWASTTTATVNTAEVSNPAPQAVYQSQRVGQSFTYTIPGLTAGASYGVRLDFSEMFWSSTGKRIFNVTINGTNVLSNFDIFATAGAQNTAVAESFTTTANSAGTIVIALSATTDNAAIDGIEISSSATTTPTPVPVATALYLNAGGPATGSFLADQDYTPANGTWASTTTATVNTAGVSNPAPQAVYQSQRVGQSFTYTIPGLTAGASYGVRLDFSEMYWSSAGKRIFNVTINGAKVLSNFDIFATAGAQNTAVAESFTATASSGGTIVVVLTATTDNAAIDGIEITSGGAGTPTASPTGTPTASPTPTPTPAPATPTPGPVASGVYINAGGAASGSFLADQDYYGGTWASSTTTSIVTTGITNPPPQAVLDSQRTGQSFTYTIPGLTAGQAYNVRLDFAEIWWSAAGERVFNVTINGTEVLANFDIFATAGTNYKAVAETFTTTATPGGAIAIAFAATTDNATVNGIEITSTGASPAPTPSTSAIRFNDYVTYGYDNQRDVFNPNSTAITTAQVPNIHLAWQSPLSDYNTQTQPILATEIPGHAGVLFVGGASGNVYGYDALTGTLMWTQNTGQETYSCENGYNAEFGVGGTVAYDPSSKSLYVVGNQNAAEDAVAANSLFHLDGASGSVLGQVNFAPAVSGWNSLDFSHTAVTLSNGVAYAGTGATCDISSWRGRVVAVSVPSMTLANTFYTAWNGTTQPWGGGGVWGWGGVSLDFSGNVLTGVGNTDNGSTTDGSIVAPFVAAPEEYSGYGEAVVQLSSSLSSVIASNHPIPTSVYSGDSVDLDLNGTPVVFQPSGAGCDPLAAIQGKSGTIYLYDTTRVGSGPIAQYQLAPSSYADGFLGDPSYSPVTGLLYVAVPSSNDSLYPPGMIAINPGCGSPSIAWRAAFGPDSYAPGTTVSPGVPRSAPAVSAGGVVFVGTLCTWTGTTCSATTSSTTSTRRNQTVRKTQICCAPAGTSGGALWAIDASTGNVLNGGDPIIVTGAPIRMPPTIDGEWLFVLDNSGDMYGLTIDPGYPAIALKYRPPNPRQQTIRFR